MSAVDVRALRKAIENPFEHPDALSVSRQDIVIPAEGFELPARIYRPRFEKHIHLPALVYFHGGGFVLDDISSHDKLLSQISEKSGVVVVSVEYRLAPEARFPAPVEDAIFSYRWLFEHADQFLIDSARMAIGGDSAGANLAAVVCMINRDNADPVPVFQLLIYPCTIGNNSSESRKRFCNGPILTAQVLKWYHDQYISKEMENDPRFNILSANNHANLPEAFILTCGFDPLRDEGEAYANKLRENGVAVRHSCYIDMFHGFINFGALKQSRAAVKECATVLSEFLFRK
jgi:acetyl esterase